MKTKTYQLKKNSEGKWEVKCNGKTISFHTKKSAAKRKILFKIRRELTK